MHLHLHGIAVFLYTRFIHISRIIALSNRLSLKALARPR